MRFRIVLIGLQNIRIFGVMLRRKLAAAANLNTILKRRLHRCKRRVMTQFPTVVATHCLVLAKVDTFMNNKKCVKQCERVQQSTARSSN